MTDEPIDLADATPDGEGSLNELDGPWPADEVAGDEGPQQDPAATDDDADDGTE